MPDAPPIAPSCRFCGARLDRVFVDLGVTPLANRNLRPDEAANERKYPLVCRVCSECFLVQADDSVPPGDGRSMLTHLRLTRRSWPRRTLSALANLDWQSKKTGWHGVINTQPCE